MERRRDAESSIITLEQLKERRDELARNRRQIEANLQATDGAIQMIEKLIEEAERG
jgi:chaperonin cofactor prefoldin